MSSIRSYSSERTSTAGFLRESWCLYHSYRQNIRQRVQDVASDIRRAETLIADRLGVELRNLDILEIGPGQFLNQMQYLAMRNHIIGIDLEVIAEGANPVPYLRMLRQNGLARTTKTVARKLLGIDRRFAAEVARELGVAGSRRMDVRQMDACRITFPGNSFDFVYARSVFHHLPDPGAALDGIARVLRPGGSTYILLHLYTSETGCLDPRVFTDQRDQVLGWPHLRPDLQGTYDNHNVYLNKLRLNEWRNLFQAKMPGAQLITTSSEESAVKAAELLHARGEVLDYSVEELTTSSLAVLWRKPAASQLLASEAPGQEQLAVPAR